MCCKAYFSNADGNRRKETHYNICGRAYARITGSPDWEEEVPEESRRRRNRGTALPTPRVLSHRPRQGRGSGHDAHKDGCRGSREATASRARGENASGKGCGCRRGGHVRQCRLRSRCRGNGRYILSTYLTILLLSGYSNETQKSSLEYSNKTYYRHACLQKRGNPRLWGSGINLYFKLIYRNSNTAEILKALEVEDVLVLTEL